MLYGSHRGYDIHFTVYVTNAAFGRPPRVPDIFGFRGVVVRAGLSEGDASGVRFQNEPEEGYRQSDLANHFAAQVGRQLADDIANGAI
jgi:hypothetical protein